MEMSLKIILLSLNWSQSVVSLPSGGTDHPSGHKKMTLNPKLTTRGSFYSTLSFSCFLLTYVANSALMVCSKTNPFFSKTGAWRLGRPFSCMEMTFFRQSNCSSLKEVYTLFKKDDVLEANHS